MTSNPDLAPTDHSVTDEAEPLLAPDGVGPRRSGIPMIVRQLLPGATMLVFIVWAMKAVSDPDTFWHIAAGDYLRETWAFNGRDPWNAQSTRPWVLHEWLPQLLMSTAHEFGRLPAVAWLLPVGVSLISVLLWLSLRRYASILVATTTMAITILGMSASLSVRPHLVTFALAFVVTDTWLRTATDLRPRWWLVPLTWIWACSHGMWFLGPAVGIAVVFGMALDRKSFRGLPKLLSIPLLSLGAAALTPAGPALLGAPFGVREMTQFIQEWRPPSLSDWGFVAFLGMIGMCALLWARRERPTRWSTLGVAFLATALALMYIRTVAVGAAVIAPVVAVAIHDATGLPREPLGRRERLATVGMVALGLAVAAALAPIRAEVPGRGANDLDSQLAALPAGSVVCNDYALGGWLIWRHPHLRPAIDGRTEIFDVEYVQSYVDFNRGLPDWEQFPQRVDCNYALLSNESPPSAGLIKQEGWGVVGVGKEYVLLNAPSS